jgi:PAS domain S-box-containing protein
MVKSKIASCGDSACCAIIRSISDGVCTVDLRKRITFFNPAAESITGFSVQDAMGQYCFDVFRSNACESKCPIDKTITHGVPQVNWRGFIISKSGEKKPISVSTDLLKDSVGEIIGAIQTFRDLSELEGLRKQLARSFTYEDIVGKSHQIQEVISFLPDVAESNSSVLIYGPTGSGKELFVRAIHNLSPRKNGPFVVVNCAALPDTLLESELFGHVKGAFTGAMTNKAGRFLLADKGTLFLDEISSTSSKFQADLLRVLEHGEFVPLGGTETLRTNFRVVAATNEEIEPLIQEGKFREDLYYRLNVVKISLPPLRERKEDIPLLVDHFIQKFNLLNRKAISGVTPEVLSCLIDYSFPGNIRELENIIEYAFIRCKDDMVGLEHLAKDLYERFSNGRGPLTDSHAPYYDEEAKKIRIFLDQHGGNRIETARALGMSRSTLWRKIKKHRLMKHKM